MKKPVAIVFLLFLYAAILVPVQSSAQCSARLVITDSTFVHCKGVNYTSGELELRVDSLGMWINGDLAVPFLPFIDRISPESIQRYREAPYYNQALARGLTDRDALIATVNAEEQLLLSLQRTLHGVGPDEFEAIMPYIESDSLAIAFECEFLWSEDFGHAMFRYGQTDTWAGIGFLCGPPPPQGVSYRRWDQELPRLIETYCRQLLDAEICLRRKTPGAFRAVLLGNSSGVVGAPTLEELLNALE